jgi:hypothetical protein
MTPQEQKQKVLDRVLKYGSYAPRGQQIQARDVEVHDDLSVTIKGSFALKGKWAQLPVKFHTVRGTFDIRERGLKTLVNSPQTCVRYFCNKNSLMTLEGCPQYVEEAFNCTGCGLTSLEGAPQMGPQGWFLAVDNKLKDLQGTPSHLFSLDMSWNYLESLQGLPLHCQKIALTWHKDLPLLRLLLVQDLRVVEFSGAGFIPDRDILNNIINKYKGKGYAGMVPCARELIRAGLTGNARL